MKSDQKGGGAGQPGRGRFNRAAGRTGLRRFRVWRLAADLGGRLVFAQPLVDDLAQQVVVGPGQVFDFGDKIGPHPMHAAQNERRAEPAVSRGGGTSSGISGVARGWRRRPYSGQ